MNKKTAFLFNCDNNNMNKKTAFLLLQLCRNTALRRTAMNNVRLNQLIKNHTFKRTASAPSTTLSSASLMVSLAAVRLKLDNIFFLKSSLEFVASFCKILITVENAEEEYFL